MLTFKLTLKKILKNNAPGNIIYTGENEIILSADNFRIVDLGENSTTAKTIHYIQLNNVIEPPKTNNADAGGNLKKAELNFMVGLKNLMCKNSVDSNFCKGKTA